MADQLTIKDNRNIFLNDTYIGSACEKDEHVTGYIVTADGEEVLEQYDTLAAAAEAVRDEYISRATLAIIDLFNND